MIYECIYCNYITKDRTLWYHHKKTGKHTRNEAKYNYQLEQNNIQLNKDHELELLKEKLKAIENEKKAAENEKNIYKHQLEEAKKQHKKELENTKMQYKEQLDNTIILYEKRVEDVSKQVEHVYKQVRILENQTQFQEQLINSAGGIIKKSMNTLSYLLLNYKNAPHINRLEDYSIISKNMNDLIKNITFYYNKNKLDKYIGDFIVKQYKKDEPGNQSLWSSDTDRLNYFICEIIKKQDNKKQWILDKKGIKMTNCIIKPLLDYISEANSNYIINKSKEMDDIEHIDERITILKEMEILSSVNSDIKNNKLSTSINKYIAPHFYFDKQVAIEK